MDSADASAGEKVKATNPKDALGIKKVSLHCVPVRPLYEVALAMMEGGRKYGAHNYRAEGTRMSTYYDAAMRHLTSWWEGEDIDPDSGVHHLVKLMACVFVVRDAMHMNKCVDDRPIKYPGGVNIQEFNEVAASIIRKYPNCVEPYTEMDKGQRVVTPCDTCTDERRYEQFWCMKNCQIAGISG